MDTQDTKWESYEQVAVYLLNQFAEEFGVDCFEGKQDVEGQRSGTTWEIDGKGTRVGNEAFVIVECRRYPEARQNQAKVGSLAYSIIDSGADGAILVSPRGSQSGGLKIGKAENIVNVLLNAEATGEEYVMQFLNKIFAGVGNQLNCKSVATCEVVRAETK